MPANNDAFAHLEAAWNAAYVRHIAAGLPHPVACAEADGDMFGRETQDGPEAWDADWTD